MKILQRKSNTLSTLNVTTTIPAEQRLPTKEEINENVEYAREQLLELRRRQEEIERQKSELEELRRKQDEYEHGKTEMTENITRALVILEHEEFETQKRAALAAQSRDDLKIRLDEIIAIHDDTWTSETVSTELTKALATIENARLEYNRARMKLDCLDPKNGSEIASVVGETQPNYKNFALIGLYASSPLMIFATIWAIIFLIVKK